MTLNPAVAWVPRPNIEKGVEVQAALLEKCAFAAHTRHIC